MKDFTTQHVTCPACGVKLNGAFNTEGQRAPVDGDPGICAACLALNVYSGDPVNTLRRPTDAEEKEFLCDPQLQYIVRTLQELRRKGPNYG